MDVIWTRKPASSPAASCGDRGSSAGFGGLGLGLGVAGGPKGWSAAGAEAFFRQPPDRINTARTDTVVTARRERESHQSVSPEIRADLPRRRVNSWPSPRNSVSGQGEMNLHGILDWGQHHLPYPTPVISPPQLLLRTSVARTSALLTTIRSRQPSQRLHFDDGPI